ncbi:hypothetical protein BaRGS_00027409, partial [Batillaria attramentaria]
VVVISQTYIWRFALLMLRNLKLDSPDKRLPGPSRGYHDMRRTALRTACNGFSPVQHNVLKVHQKNVEESPQGQDLVGTSSCAGMRNYGSLSVICGRARRAIPRGAGFTG